DPAGAGRAGSVHRVHRAPRLSGIVLAAVVLAGAACSSGPGRRTAAAGGQAAPPSTAAPSTTAPTTASPPVPSPGGLHWAACGSLQCAGLPVPVDYANPTG